MLFQLQLIDDQVLIKTWSTAREAWDIWGMVHFDALFEGRKHEWYDDLRKNGAVIVKAVFELDYSLQMPGDNIS